MTDSRAGIAIYLLNLDEGAAFTNVASALVEGLAHFSVKCHVLPAVTPSGTRVHELEKRGFPVQTLGSSRTLMSLFPLARYLRRQKPEILISLGWIQNIISVLARLVSRWRGTLVITEHAYFSYEARVEHRGTLRLRIMPWLARRLYPRADAIVGVHEAVIRDLINEVGVSLEGLPRTAIPNGINLDRVRQLSCDSAEHPWMHRSDIQVLLYVGRLAVQKNICLLLTALANLPADQDVRLLVLGEGPERDRVTDIVSDLSLTGRVELLGHVSNPYAFMRGADLLVLPSREEGFGLVLVEAMASGCPVVATACSEGPVDILENGKSGVLIPPNDVEALTAAVSQLLTDPARRADLSARGLTRANDFSAERVVAQWLAFLSELKARKE